MPCSSCSADLLRSFLRTFNLHHTQVLQRHAIRPIHRRALHTGPALHITSGTSRAVGRGAVEDLPIKGLDNVYLPFDRSKAKPGWAEDSAQSTTGAVLDYTIRPAAVESLGEVQSGTPSSDDIMEAENFWEEPKVRIRDPLRDKEALDRDTVQNSTPKDGDPGRKRRVGSSKETLPNKRQASLASSSPTATSKSDPKTTSRPRSQSSRTPREPWQTQKAALDEKFGTTGWQPRKRLSPDALDGIRALHAQYPQTYTTAALAEQFKVSPEAIRRILKSKWRPSEEEDVDRRQRWQKRGGSIWSQMVELGVKPPKKWREMGVGRKTGGGERRRDGRGEVPSERGGDGEEGIDVVDEFIEAHKVEGEEGRYPGRRLSERIL